VRTSTARPGRLAAQRPQPVEPLGVGQPEVEQDAVEARQVQRRRPGERARPFQHHRRTRERELLLDEERVAVVVLDQQDPHGVGGDRHGWTGGVRNRWHAAGQL
jgi:hypothetical protein